jgi:hydroxypyruvate isomerase
MERRTFMQKTVLAGASIVTAGITKPSGTKTGFAEKPFNLNYGIHDGMFRNSAGNEFTDQIKYAYDMGFRAIEDNGLTGRPTDQQL